jgi:hypothetical protein
MFRKVRLHYREYMVLVMAEDGTVYAGYDDELFLFGKNGINAIENIVNNWYTPEIP